MPTSIPYEVAVCGSRYGIIFEKIRSDSLGHLISSRPEMMEQYAAQYAALARTLHGIHTQRTVFPELKAELEQRLPRLAPFCTEADMRLLEDLITRIPDADNLIFRNIADDAHYRRHPKKDWPLYDRLADFLGENTLAQHNEALRLRDEEEADDEWRASIRRD